MPHRILCRAKRFHRAGQVEHDIDCTSKLMLTVTIGGKKGPNLIGFTALTARYGNIFLFLEIVSSRFDLYSPFTYSKMAITDMLNRRVRARPDDEDDVYSEQSDAGEEPSQDEAEENDDSEAEDLQSDDVCAFLQLQQGQLLTSSFTAVTR